MTIDKRIGLLSSVRVCLHCGHTLLPQANRGGDWYGHSPSKRFNTAITHPDDIVEEGQNLWKFLRGFYNAPEMRIKICRGLVFQATELPTDIAALWCGKQGEKARVMGSICVWTEAKVETLRPHYHMGLQRTNLEGRAVYAHYFGQSREEASFSGGRPTLSSTVTPHNRGSVFVTKYVSRKTPLFARNFCRVVLRNAITAPVGM